MTAAPNGTHLPSHHAPHDRNEASRGHPTGSIFLFFIILWGISCGWGDGSGSRGVSASRSRLARRDRAIRFERWARSSQTRASLRSPRPRSNSPSRSCASGVCHPAPAQPSTAPPSARRADPDPNRSFGGVARGNREPPRYAPRRAPSSPAETRRRSPNARPNPPNVRRSAGRPTEKESAPIADLLAMTANVRSDTKRAEACYSPASAIPRGLFMTLDSGNSGQPESPRLWQASEPPCRPT